MSRMRRAVYFAADGVLEVQRQMCFHADVCARVRLPVCDVVTDVGHWVCRILELINTDVYNVYRFMSMKIKHACARTHTGTCAGAGLQPQAVPILDGLP